MHIHCIMIKKQSYQSRKLAEIPVYNHNKPFTHLHVPAIAILNVQVLDLAKSLSKSHKCQSILKYDFILNKVTFQFSAKKCSQDIIFNRFLMPRECPVR